MPRSRVFIATLGFVAALIVLPMAAVAQTNGTWTNTLGGTWSDTANWSGGTVASGTGAAADFSTLNINTTRTVTLNAAYTLGSLSFADTSTTSTGSWVISNGGTIGNTLTLAAGTGTTPVITVSGMGGGSATINARISGTQGLSLNTAGDANAGLLVLSGSNNYTGNTSINSGTVSFSTNASWSALTGTFSVSNATLIVTTTNTNGTDWTRPIVAGGTGITLGLGNSRINWSSVISGTGGVTFGVGTHGVGGLSTYSGPTTLGAGVNIILSATGATGSGGAPISGAFGTGTVTLAGGNLRTFSGTPLNVVINNVVNVTADTAFGALGNTSVAVVLAGPMTLVGGTRTFTTSDGGGNPIQFNGSIGDGGNGFGLIKAGNRLLVLGGSNTYSGATTLTSGTLRLDNQNAVLNSTFTHSGTGALVFNSSVSGNAFTFGGLAASSTAAMIAVQNNAGTPAAVTLTVGGNNASTLYAGSLTGSGSVVKVGSGILSLSGSNSYAGTMTVSGGVLSVSSSNALPGWGTAGRVAVGAAGSLAVGNDMTLQQAIDAGYFDAASGWGFDTTAGNRTVSEAISGSRTFVKTGGNTLTLTGENDFSAPTTVTSGTLQIGDGGGTGSIASNVTLLNSSAIIFNRSGSLAYSASISGTGAFTKSGSGTLTLSGSSSYVGTTTLAGGVLALDNANAIAAAGNIAFTGGSLQYSASNTADLSSRIVSSTGAIAIDTNGQSVAWAGNIASTNSGGLSKTGAGTLTLSGSNTFTGVVSVTGGTLALGGPNTFPTGVTGLSLNGGVLQSSGSVSPGDIPSGATITLGASGGTLLSSLPGQTQWWIRAPITGSAGSGPLVLSGATGEFIVSPSSASSYTGGTTVSATRVAIDSDVAFGTGTITFAGGGLRSTSSAARTLSNAVTISAGASFYGTSRDLTLAGPITLSGSTQTVTVTGTGVNNVFSGSVGDGSAGLGLTKSGVGILVLAGANTYSGTTTVAGGTLRLANLDALAGGGNLSFTGGTLQYSDSNQGDYSAKIVGSSSAIAIDTNGQSVAYASPLVASNGGGLTKSGSGTLTLAANNAYAGLTTVSGGTLQIGDGGTTGSITGNVTLSNTTALIFNRSNSLAYSGSISGTGSLTKAGAGTLTLSGSNSYVGGTTIAGGTLSIANGNALAGSFTLDGGTIVNATGASSFGKVGGVPSFHVGPGGGAVRSDIRIDPNSVISGTSSMALLTYGPATTGSSGILLVISSNNTYAANTKLEAGMAVVVDNNNAFGTGALELAGASIRTRQQGSSPPRSLANAVTFSANTQFNGGASEPSLTFTGSATLSGGTRTFQVDSVITSGSSAGQPGVIFTNVIGDGGNGFGITKTGAGVLALSGANTYSGVTTLSAGTIQLQNQAALQNSTLVLSGSGGVVFDSVVSGNAFALGGLSASNSAATLALQNSATTAIALTVGGNNASTTYAGSLTGGGSLEKVGTGSLILSGSNTFTGPATVTSGTLQIGNGATGSIAGNIVNNASLVFGRSNAASYSGRISGSGSVTNSGAGTFTLSGSNSYAGPTTLAAGTLGLGSAAALPASGTVTFTGGAVQYSASYTVDLSSQIAGSTGPVAIDTNNQNIAFLTGLAASNVGGLTKLGSGTLTLSATNAFTGPVTVGGGVLAAGNAAALPASGNVSFTGGTLQYSASYTADLSSRIVGSSAAITIDTNNQNSTWVSSLANTNVGGLTKSGNGTLTLSASNAYAGVTTVSGGILLVNNATALGSGTGVSVSLNGAALTIGSGITTGAGKTVTISSNGANNDGGLNVLSGTGTWVGDVIMSGRLGYTNGNLVVTGSVGGSSFAVSGYGGDTNTNVSGYAVTLAGPTGYSGATSILRGWLKIGADNTLPLGTTLDVFIVANNGAAAQAATFDLNGFNQTVAGLTSSGNNGKTGYANGYVTNTGVSVKTLTVNQATTGTYGGLITGNLAFTKSGAGNLTLMPIFVTGLGNAFVNGTNTFTGDTLVSAGTLTLSSATTSTSLALAASAFDSSGAGTLSFGSMTAATFGGLKGSGNLALQNDSSQAVALTVGASNGSTTYSGNLSGLGSLVKNGSGTLTLSGSNGYTGSTQITAGVLALANGNALAGTGTVSFTGGSLQYGSGVSTDLSTRIRGSSSAIRIDTNGEDVAFAGAINNTNTAGLTKSGAGTLTLSGSNAYAGNTTVNAGTLAFTADSVWTGLSGTIALDNATLAYTGTSVVNQFMSLPIQIGASGGTLRNPGSAFLFVGGQISGAGPLTVGSGSTLMVFQGANTNSGGVTLQAGSQIVVANNSSGPAGAPTSGVFGTGTLTLAGGSLRSTTGAARTVGNSVSVTADTTFFTAGANDDKSITFTGPVTLAGASRTFTVDTTGTGSPAINFTGAISDGGNGYGLTKAGAGTLVLGGANTYTGQTAVSSGALVVNGSILSSVALSGSTLLGGNGSVGAISGAGLVGPGNSPGILSATSVNPTGGLDFAFEFTQANPDYTNAAASGNDVLSISGLSPFTSSLASTNVVSIYLTPAAAELGTLTGGFFTSSLQSDFLTSISSATYQYFVQDAGGSFSYNGLSYKSLGQYDSSKSVTVSTVAANGGQVMQMVVVPEPAALALAGIGIVVAGWVAAKRRRQ